MAQRFAPNAFASTILRSPLPVIPDPEITSSAEWRSRLAVPALACCVFLLLTTVIFLRIRQLNGGPFTYALDDAYIHLGLSDQIAHGHYGINENEYSSPASSILWPFLLALFSPSSIHLYLPLLLSMAAGLVAVYALARIMQDLSPGRDWWTVAMTVLLIFCANLVSLPFLGLEHEVQVMLAIVCAAGLIRVWNGRHLPTWAAVAAAIGPSVRYESLAITLAVVLVLAGMRELRRAALVFVAAVVPVGAFSVFLRHLGLEALPSSVLLKSRQQAVGEHVGSRLLHLVWSPLAGLHHPVRWPLAVLTGLLVYLFVREPDRRKRLVLGAALLVGVLQLLGGPFGWFHRYEVYAAIFVTVIWVRAAWASQPLHSKWRMLWLLCFLSTPYLVASLQTPVAAHEIYCQQFQMGRFAHDYYRRSVAVNDLGVVSYRRPPQVFVLDLWGLASYEAGTANRSPEWLARTVAARHVGLAMVYADWFNPPPSWTHIGELCVRAEPIVVAEQCVDFYGITAASTAELEPELRRFSATLPADVDFVFGATPRSMKQI